jgi:hypothetical protein
LSSNGNNGTLVNGTGYNSSGVGSMVFDGTNDYVSFGNAASLQITNALTVDVWLKANTSGDFITAVAKSNGATGGWTVQLRNLVNEWRFWVNFGVNTLGNGSNNGWYYANFPKTWNDNKWHHFVGIWDGSSKTVKLYIDGIQGTFNAGGNPSGESGSIGNYNGNLVAGSETGGNNPLNGNISSLKVYNIAFSPEQVLQNFNAQKYRFGYYDSVQDGLIFNLDAGNYLSYPRSGTTWTDLTGKGNNGTLTNGPTFSGGTTPSIVFDGSDDYVNCINNTNITGSKPSTMEITCEFTSLPLTFVNAMMQIGEGSGHGNFRLLYLRYVSGETPQPRLSVAWYDSGFVTNFTPTQNQIYTFTYTDNGSNESKIYINGSLLTTYTSYTPLETNTNALYIGKFSYGGVLSGKVYNSKIYNRVLTPQEVIQNFESQRVNYGITGITTNGLVLNLDAANTASYNGSGTTWVDISGSEFDGILTNGPTYVSSGASSSISFDGTDDYCDISGTTNFNSNILTFSLWFKTNSTNLPFGYVFAKQIDGSYGSFWFYTVGGNSYRLGCGTNNSYSESTSFSPNINTWYHIVGVYNGTNMLFYLNGSLTSTTAYAGGAPIKYASYPISLGRYGSLFTNQISSACNIASFLLYNRDLSASEVLNNYNATKSRFGL